MPSISLASVPTLKRACSVRLPDTPASIKIFVLSEHISMEFPDEPENRGVIDRVMVCSFRDGAIISHTQGFVLCCMHLKFMVSLSCKCG